MVFLENRVGLSKWQVRTLSVFLYLVVALTSDNVYILQRQMGYFRAVMWHNLSYGIQHNWHRTGYLDVVPRFSGFVNTIANTLAAVAGTFRPGGSLSFLVEHGDVQGWNYLFVLTIALTMCGFLVWVLFAEVEVNSLINTPSKPKLSLKK